MQHGLRNYSTLVFPIPRVFDASFIPSPTVALVRGAVGNHLDVVKIYHRGIIYGNKRLEFCEALAKLNNTFCFPHVAEALGFLHLGRKALVPSQDMIAVRCGSEDARRSLPSRLIIGERY